MTDNGLAGSPAAGSFPTIEDAIKHFFNQFDGGIPADDAFWSICRSFLTFATDQRMRNFSLIMLILCEIKDVAKERIAKDAVDILSDYDFKKISFQNAKEMLSKLDSVKKQRDLPAPPAYVNHPAKDLSAIPAPQIPLQNLAAVSAPALATSQKNPVTEEEKLLTMQDIGDDRSPTLDDLARVQLYYMYAGSAKNYQGAAARAIRYLLRRPEAFELNYAELNWICDMCVQAAQNRMTIGDDDPPAIFLEARRALEEYRSLRSMVQLQASLRNLFGDGSLGAALSL